MVVATPAALMNQLFAADPRRMRHAAFIRDLAMLVSAPPCLHPNGVRNSLLLQSSPLCGFQKAATKLSCRDRVYCNLA